MPDAAGALTRVTLPPKKRSSVLAMRSAPRWTCWLLRRGRSCGGSTSHIGCWAISVRPKTWSRRRSYASTWRSLARCGTLAVS